MELTEPLFIVDLRDMATGKQVAVRVTRDEALLPLGALLRRVLHGDVEALVADGRLAPAAADTAFRLQDLVYPVDERGELATTPYAGLALRWRDAGPPLDPTRPALFDRWRQQETADVLVLPLDIDRQGYAYDRHWPGFHARRFRRFQPAVDALVKEAFPHGAADDRAFIAGVARRIAAADFENYTRFQPPWIRLKTGDETIANIHAGGGGVCTEKVLALKFVTDARGLASRVVFAGPNTHRAPLPITKLRTMLDELDSYDFTYARRYLRYWDHVALEYTLNDGDRLLVDPSGGNIPFLCEPAEPFFADGAARRTVPTSMLALSEPVSYHATPEALGLDFLFAWETWVADVDLMQVFDNRLGLLVARDFYVTAVAYGSPTKRAHSLASWQAYAVAHGLGFAALAGTSDAAAPAPALPIAGDPAVLAAFQERLPRQAAACVAALPALARRYRAFTLALHGIDKPFGADLVVLDRRPLLREVEPPDRLHRGDAVHADQGGASAWSPPAHA